MENKTSIQERVTRLEEIKEDEEIRKTLNGAVLTGIVLGIILSLMIVMFGIAVTTQ